MSDGRKHTAGPWKRDEYGMTENARSRWCQILDSGGNLIACLGDAETGNERENAAIIAAAPDMLEALRMSEAVIRDIVDSFPNASGMDDDKEVLAAVRAAIAKATGEGR